MTFAPGTCRCIVLIAEMEYQPRDWGEIISHVANLPVNDRLGKIELIDHLQSGMRPNPQGLACRALRSNSQV